MTSSVSQERHSDAKLVDFWSSHPINWPVLYTIGALMLAVAGISLWMGDYGSAANTALILAVWSKSETVLRNQGLNSLLGRSRK